MTKTLWYELNGIYGYRITDIKDNMAYVIFESLAPDQHHGWQKIQTDRHGRQFIKWLDRRIYLTNMYK